MCLGMTCIIRSDETRSFVCAGPHEPLCVGGAFMSFVETVYVKRGNAGTSGLSGFWCDGQQL